MIGLIVFALYLAATLLAKKQPQDAERHVTMIGYLLFVPAVLTQQFPPTILPMLSLFLASA